MEEGMIHVEQKKREPLGQFFLKCEKKSSPEKVRDKGDKGGLRRDEKIWKSCCDEWE